MIGTLRRLYVGFTLPLSDNRPGGEQLAASQECSAECPSHFLIEELSEGAQLTRLSGRRRRSLSVETSREIAERPIGRGTNCVSIHVRRD